MIDFKHAMNKFEKYLENFDSQYGKIELKIRHTYGVIEASEYIANKLNTVGTMTSLKRTKQGQFDIKDATDIDNLKVMSISECLKDYFTVITDDKMYKLVTNGVKLKNLYNKDTVLFKDKDNNPIALYKLEEDTLKLWKMF